MSSPTSVSTFLAQILTDPGMVGTIADSAANITLSLPALELAAPSIGSITSTNGVVTVGVGTLHDDQAALDKITGGFAVSDSVANIAANLPLLDTDDNIVGVTGTDGQVNVSVAAFEANQKGLDKITGGFLVMDTAANISAGLDALNGDGLLLSITDTDSKPVGVSVAQVTSDATAIGKLRNADLSTPQLAVTDTAAAIETGLARLQAEEALIGTITATGGPVVISVTTFGADRAALDKIVGGFTIMDTVAAVGGSIAALAGDTRIAAVKVTNGPFVAAIATLAADQAFLDKIVGGFAVSDTAAAVKANLARLAADARITTITATGGPVIVDVKTFAADRVALDKIVGGFAVADTAAAVQGSLAALASDAALASITVSGGPLTVIASTFAADRAALDKIAGGFAVADTAAGISSVLDALRDPQATRATITDNAPITLSVAQLSSDAAALAKLRHADGTAVTFAVADTGAHVAAGLPALKAALAAITAITTTGAPATVTLAQFAAEQPVLDRITGGFIIADTAANIQAALAAIIRDTSHIVSIRSTAGTVMVSVASFLANKPTLDKIASRFGVADTAAVLAANLPAIVADHAVASTTTIAGGVPTAQTYYNLDGSVYFNDTIRIDASGNVTYHCFGGSLFAGRPYASFDNVVDHTGYLSLQILYAASGAVIGQTTFNRDGSVLVADTVTTDAAGDSVVHFAGGSFFAGKSFAAFDNVLSPAGKLLAQTLYDASGTPTAQSFYNADGSLLLQGSVTRGAAGTLTTHYTTGSFFAGKTYASFDKVVSASGVLQAKTFYDGSGFATETDTYNADGSLALKETINKLPNGVVDDHYAGGSFFSGKSYAAFDRVYQGGVLQSQTLLDGTGSPLEITSYNADGSILLQDSISRPAAGETLHHAAGGSFFDGKAFSAFDNLFDGQGNLLSQTVYSNDGSHSVFAPGSNLTLTAAHNDTFTATGSNETVIFAAPGFGADTFKGFAAGDTFVFSTSIFAGYQDLSSHVAGTGSATISDTHGDTLTLAGVAPTSLSPAMFKFV